MPVSVALAFGSSILLILPKLIMISGYPSSGKTYRSKQIISYLEKRIFSLSTETLTTSASPDITASSSASSSRLTRLSVVHINDQTLNIPRNAYALAKTEKDARAALTSAIKRALGKDVIVIADALNYIKGFRYQLFCEAKALGTPSCVVSHSYISIYACVSRFESFCLR